MARKGFFNKVFKDLDYVETETVLTANILKLFENKDVIDLDDEFDVYSMVDNYTLLYGKEIKSGSYIFYIWYRYNYYIKISCIRPLMEIIHYSWLIDNDESTYTIQIEFLSENTIIPQIQKAIRYLSSLFE